MIEFKNAIKEFEPNKKIKVTAVSNISFKIDRSQLVVLKGTSGSGKSTILSMLAALLTPTSGEIIVNDRVVSKLHDNFASLYRRETIGFIFQKYNLIPNLTVQENIIVPLIPSNPDMKILDQKVDELLDMFNISHKKDADVQNLSGGEQQRVAIARSLINDPSIIIADEPTANLDEALSIEFLNILKNLKAQGRTIIVATHDPLFFNFEEVDKIIELKNGKIISE